MPQNNHVRSDPTNDLSALYGSCVSALERNWWSKYNLKPNVKEQEEGTDARDMCTFMGLKYTDVELTKKYTSVSASCLLRYYFFHFYILTEE